jgi:hypothetical protein
VPTDPVPVYQAAAVRHAPDAHGVIARTITARFPATATPAKSDMTSTAVLRELTAAGLLIVRDATPDGRGDLDQVRRRDTIARTAAKIRAAAVVGDGNTAVLRLRGDEITLLADLVDALRTIAAAGSGDAARTARAALGWDA